MPTWHNRYDFKLKKDKFRIITGRYVIIIQSTTANNDMLKDVEEENYPWINSNDAKGASDNMIFDICLSIC